MSDKFSARSQLSLWLSSIIEKRLTTQPRIDSLVSTQAAPVKRLNVGR
jgi:hypothetical protein